MFPGYLVLGGTEVFNQARTYTYVEESDCPAGWLRCLPCPGLEDALGVDSYVNSLSNAPWYDDADPATHKFLGIYPIQMDGLDSSTRTATIQEGILDGGVIQGTRRAVREIRVRGVMVGIGHDGLDAGLSWLDAVLDGNTCSTHQGACGEVDGCFWVTCPPERPTMTDYTPFDVVNRNYALDPSARVATTASWSSDGATASRVAGTAFNTTYAARFTSTTATMRVGPKASLAVSTQHSVRLQVRTSKAWTGMTLNYRPSGPATSTGETVIASGLSMSTTPKTLEYTFTTSATAPAATASVVLVTTTGVVADWIEIAEVMIAKGEYAPVFFDGDTTDTAIANYSWAGTVNASQSIYEARSEIQVPVPDSTYDAILDPLRRRMHGLTAISGPLVLQHFHNENYHAYEIEFTLAAATPYIYGEPKVLTLPSTSPSVVQDSPFNLVPYPSAEITGGTLVVATNYTTNPSVEVNATNWASFFDPGIPVGMRSSARVTELAAGGSSASYRSRVLGDNGTTVVTNAVSYMENIYITTPIATGTNRRVSVSVWAALILSAGGSGTSMTNLIGSVDFFTAADALVGSVVPLGTTTQFNGTVFSAKSIAVPATATKVRVTVRANFVYSSSATAANNTDLRLYTDTLAVTVP